MLSGFSRSNKVQQVINYACTLYTMDPRSVPDQIFAQERRALRHIPGVHHASCDETRRQRQRQEGQKSYQLPATSYGVLHVTCRFSPKTRLVAILSYLLPLAPTRSSHLPHVPLHCSFVHLPHASLGRTPCHSSSHLTCRAPRPAPLYQKSTFSSTSVPIQVQHHPSSPLLRSAGFCCAPWSGQSSRSDRYLQRHPRLVESSLPGTRLVC